MSHAARYATDGVRPRDRFAYWSDAVCDSFVALGCRTDRPCGFSGRLDIARHSLLSVSRVSGRAHGVERRPSDIRRATDAFFLLSLQLAGTTRISQFGQDCVLATGDMAIYTSTRPYTLDLSDDFEQLVVQMPADRLVSRLPSARMLAARRIDGSTGIGQLVRQSLGAFADHAIGPNAPLRVLVQETMIDLIATGVASISDGAAELSSPEEHVLLRTRSHIRSNFAEPTLNRESVASAIGLSVRRLNAILAKRNESLTGMIRQVRIDASKSMLHDSRFAGQSVSEIAMSCGFNSLQHFSSLFRTRTGQSPREFRKDA